MFESAPRSSWGRTSAFDAFKSPSFLRITVSRTFTHEVEVQFRDLDTRAHVNHVVYAAYFERAKERLFEEVLGVSLSEASTFVRALDVEYRKPIAADETVAVDIGPVSVGESSIRLEYELRVDGEVVATGHTVSVYVDDEERPARVPDGWRDALAPYGE